MQNQITINLPEGTDITPDITKLLNSLNPEQVAEIFGKYMESNFKPEFHFKANFKRDEMDEIITRDYMRGRLCNNMNSWSIRDTKEYKAYKEDWLASSKHVNYLIQKEFSERFDAHLKKRFEEFIKNDKSLNDQIDLYFKGFQNNMHTIISEMLATALSTMIKQSFENYSNIEMLKISLQRSMNNG